MEELTPGFGYGQSHAKIILIGEHSVVYGQPAIALPISAITAQAELKIMKTKRIIKSSYYDGPLEQMPKTMNGIKHLIDYLCEQLLLEKQGFELTIKSQLPAERGMGSSAAVAVAIIRSFYNYAHIKLSNDKLLKLAEISELDTHKNPSGLDAATSASDTPIWMIRQKEIYPIPIKLDAYLVICDSGIKGQTSSAINIVKQRLLLEPQKTQAAIEALGQLTKKTREVLGSQDVVLLGEILNQAQANLKQLGVSLPEIDRYLHIAKQHGALGAKLTGGGRGGCFICLTKDKATAIQLAQTLKAHGVTRTWIETLVQQEENHDTRNS